MMISLLLLAQRGANSPINRWLNENPLILGLLALGIGLLVGGWGVREMICGVAHDKWGREVEGDMGTMYSIVRVILGVGACGFGIYKIVVSFLGG